MCCSYQLNEYLAVKRPQEEEKKEEEKKKNF
jgi:hypothetical protein